MTPAPAVDLEQNMAPSLEKDAPQESGEFIIEKSFAEKGVEGLKQLAGKDVESALERVQLLAEVPMDVAQTAMEAFDQLKTLKEKTESELLAAKKKLFLALGENPDIEQAQAQLEPLKQEVAKQTEALAVAEEKAAELPTNKEEAVIEAEQPFSQSQVAEIPIPEDTGEQMIVESNKAEGAEFAAQMEVAPGRMNPMEELEVPETKQEAPSLDWETLENEEKAKNETAKMDYQQAEKALNDFRTQRPGKLLPIEQKYVSALEAQLEMDRLASAHAENQLALYDVNKQIETLASNEEKVGDVDTLIQQRNAKDLHSRNLAEEYEAAVKVHDTALEDYEVSLEKFSEARPEPAEETAEQASIEAAVDTEETTGGSYGGDNFEKKFTLTPEDEANFEARQAGVAQDKDSAGLLKRASTRAKDVTEFFSEAAGSAMNPSMGPTSESGGGKEKKKNKFISWFFSNRWLPWGKD